MERYCSILTTKYMAICQCSNIIFFSFSKSVCTLFRFAFELLKLKKDPLERIVWQKKKKKANTLCTLMYLISVEAPEVYFFRFKSTYLDAYLARIVFINPCTNLDTSFKLFSSINSINWFINITKILLRPQDGNNITAFRIA